MTTHTSRLVMNDKHNIHAFTHSRTLVDAQKKTLYTTIQTHAHTHNGRKKKKRRPMTWNVTTSHKHTYINMYVYISYSIYVYSDCLPFFFCSVCVSMRVLRSHLSLSFRPPHSLTRRSCYKSCSVPLNGISSMTCRTTLHTLSSSSSSSLPVPSPMWR